MQLRPMRGGEGLRAPPFFSTCQEWSIVDEADILNPVLEALFLVVDDEIRAEFARGECTRAIFATSYILPRYFFRKMLTPRSTSLRAFFAPQRSSLLNSFPFV
jgi:hypothetical protein